MVRPLDLYNFGLCMLPLLRAAALWLASIARPVFSCVRASSVTGSVRRRSSKNAGKVGPGERAGVHAPGSVSSLPNNPLFLTLPGSGSPLRGSSLESVLRLLLTDSFSLDPKTNYNQNKNTKELFLSLVCLYICECKCLLQNNIRVSEVHCGCAVRSGQALPDYLITAHHLYAFLR